MLIGGAESGDMHEACGAFSVSLFFPDASKYHMELVKADSLNWVELFVPFRVRKSRNCENSLAMQDMSEVDW